LALLRFLTRILEKISGDAALVTREYGDNPSDGKRRF